RGRGYRDTADDGVKMRPFAVAQSEFRGRSFCRPVTPRCMAKTLFLSPPSFDGFDGGAGSRYQARREVTSYWYPTWLAQPAALVPGARLLDCPPHQIGQEECLRIARDHSHVIIHT